MSTPIDSAVIEIERAVAADYGHNPYCRVYMLDAKEDDCNCAYRRMKLAVKNLRSVIDREAKT